MQLILKEHSGLNDVFGLSDFSDDELMDESIKASIDRIRKEAARMDLYIALDQIDSLKQENGAVESKLRATKAELDTLKDKVSSLTMERDLLKVDTNNLREDMTTLIGKMFEISCVAGNSSLADSNHPIVHNDGSCSQPDEISTIPSDVMIVSEPHSSCESDPSQSDGRFLPLRPDGGRTNRNEKVKCTNSESNSIAPAATFSYCSATAEKCQSSVVGSMSECPEKKQICPSSPSLRLKKSSKAPSMHVYTLSLVERKRTVFRRLVRWLTSCSRSRQVAALQDQLDQLQSMVRLSITTTEEIQMRMAHANSSSLVDCQSEFRHL